MSHHKYDKKAQDWINNDKCKGDKFVNGWWVLATCITLTYLSLIFG